MSSLPKAWQANRAASRQTFDFEAGALGLERMTR